MPDVSRKATDDDQTLRGGLQLQVMSIVWRLRDATVEDGRLAQPARGRSAHNTIQTVMNRLVDRGLLRRERRGNAYAYRPSVDETGYLTRIIGARLADASPQARSQALMNVVGELDGDDLDEIARYARRISRERKRRDG